MNIPSNCTKIALTGGPCAGKSKILKYLRKYYEEKGFSVYTLPESATIFIEAGADFLTQDAHLSFVTESEKLKFQLAMEDTLIKIAAATGKPTLFFCDRGTMDTSAYIPAQVWEEIKCSVGMKEEELCDERYTAVIHLCTAAKGVEDHYSLSSNDCRSESLEKARQVDDRLLAAWQRHPAFHIVNAEKLFDTKMQNVLSIINKLLKL